MRNVADPLPVDTPETAEDDDDSLMHVYCSHVDRTWCGLDASQMDRVSWPVALDLVCRVCILAVEMWADDSPCPICGCTTCLS